MQRVCYWKLATTLPPGLKRSKVLAAIERAWTLWKRELPEIGSSEASIGATKVVFSFDAIFGEKAEALAVCRTKDGLSHIIFNTRYRWSTLWLNRFSLFTPPENGIIEETALHEIGHVFGIKHIDDRKDCVMSPMRSRNDEAPRLTLTDRDVEAARFALNLHVA